MSSKLNTARKMASVGVMTHIANIAEPNVITRLVLGSDKIGSKVIPRAQINRARNFWLSLRDKQAQITANWGLVAALVNMMQLVFYQWELKHLKVILNVVI